MRVHLYASLDAPESRNGHSAERREGSRLTRFLDTVDSLRPKALARASWQPALDVPVSVMETAGEGGAWGIALLAAYMNNKAEDEALDDYLDAKVFAGQKGTKMDPVPRM